jgi:hypothetical protein
MARFAPVIRLLAIGALALTGSGTTASAQDEKLVTARFSALTDKRGNRWDINQMGGVSDGLNDCFDNGALLRIDGAQFGANRPMMTADGREYVLTGRVRTINVTRRIRLDADNGALRYLEIFENKGSAPQNIQVTIHTDLGGAASQVLDLNDKLYFGSPSRDDPAFFAMGGSGRPGVIFLMGGPKSKSKPTVRISEGRSYDIVYPLQIPANDSVAIVHYLAQRMNGSSNDARDLVAVYSKRGRLTDPNIPKEYEKILANFNLGPSTDDLDKPSLLLAPLQTLAENAGMSREKADNVLIDEGSKLVGTITGGDFEIETVHGKTPVSFANVAGVEGGAGVARPIRVFLRDGEVLSGLTSGARVQLSTDGGLQVDVDLAQIRLLTMRASANDGVAAPNAAHLLTTQRGDCIALSADPAPALETATPWGMARIPFAEVRMLSSVREPFPAHQLALADRSRLVVMLRGGEIVVPTLRFGPVKLVPQSIRKLQGLKHDSPPQETTGEEPGIAGPYLDLVGENRMVGSIDLAALHVAAESSTTAIEPRQILQIVAESSEATGRSVVVKLVGGQELKGRLAENVLPIRAGDRAWRVPVAHLVGFHAPEPRPAGEEAKEAKQPETAKATDAAPAEQPTRK